MYATISTARWERGKVAGEVPEQQEQQQTAWGMKQAYFRTGDVGR